MEFSKLGEKRHKYNESYNVNNSEPIVKHVQGELIVFSFSNKSFDFLLLLTTLIQVLNEVLIF